MRITVSILICIAILAFPIQTDLLPGVLHFNASPREAPERATILFGGDMMFDRSVRTAAQEKGFDFILSCMKDELQRHDAVIANLEGPITSEHSVSVGSRVGESNNTRFTFPIELAGVLASHNITAVSLANNHIRDFGSAGIEETREVLRNAGIAFFGDPLKDEHASTRIHVNGMPITLIGFNAFYGTNENTVLEHIAENATESFVIVFAHWGDEYVPASERQRSWAHAFVDAGADMVVGAHPHVVQEHEYYKGVPIYYSLGNFIFDQYFSEDVRNGLLLQATFSKGRLVEIVEVPVALTRDRRTCITQ